MAVPEQPLVAIVGPTGSGKTELSVKLAQHYNGEIICADSRTIYRGLDIGTAKPSQSERARVPHHMIDVVGPGESFTVVDFQRQATALIKDIRLRGKIPFMVGGSGLYIDSVLFDYKFTSHKPQTLTPDLLTKTVGELKDYCIDNNIELPENDRNKRYLIRAIQQKGVNRQRRSKPIEHTIVVGIATNKESLIARLRLRLNKIFTNKVVEETAIFGQRYGWNSEAMKGNVYRVAKQFIDGELTLEQAKEKALTLDWQLAKKQLTWLRRNPFIQWYSIEDAEKYISQLLEHRQRQ
ncbi:MAG TPA: tRNA (adenosine(37)-N6)-dimethylallyltransferase MiaA [Candidatus Saccharimonadales bacterium]